MNDSNPNNQFLSKQVSKETMEPILANKNKHERDAYIRFYDVGHKYEITSDPTSEYTSVTTWVHTHFPKFDADSAIDKMVNGRNWCSDHKYWGQTPEQIKESWKNNGNMATEAGKLLHERIEHFMNNEHLNNEYTHKDLFEHEYNSNSNLEKEPKEWRYFLKFVESYPHLKPYRTEWMIYDEDLKIAGSIDMVYENPDGTLSIYDWKRSKEIVKANDWDKFSTNPTISHIPDLNFWHYSLQLNTYKSILERKYGKTIKDLYLVRLHPNNVWKTYELLEVPDLHKEMSDLFQEREREQPKKVKKVIKKVTKPKTIETNNTDDTSNKPMVETQTRCTRAKTYTYTV